MLLQEQSLLLRQQADSRRAEETKHTHSETNAIKHSACTVPDCLAHFFRTLQVCDGESDRKYKHLSVSISYKEKHELIFCFKKTPPKQNKKRFKLKKTCITTAFLHKADTLMKTELRRFVKWHQLLPHLVLLVAELLKSIAEAKRHKEEERMQ